MQGVPPLAPVQKASTFAMHFSFLPINTFDFNFIQFYWGSQADPKISSEVGLQDGGFSFFWVVPL